MEKYRKIITTRIYLLILVVLVAIGVGIFDVFYATVEMKASDVFGFQCGLTISIGFMAVILIIKYSKSLQNEDDLRIQFNEEYDERMNTIRSKAGVPMILISSFLMMGVGIVFSYYNAVIFYTLIATALCQMVLACGTKFIYSRIMQ